MRAVLVTIIAALLALVIYQGAVIAGQRSTIQQMMDDPACKGTSPTLRWQ